MNVRERSTFDRLSVRKAGILLLVFALATGAGCAGVLDDGGSGGDDLVDNVPADQNVLIEVDADLFTDDTTRQLLEGGSEQRADAPNETQVQAAATLVENETGLDPRDVERVLLFGQSDEVQDAQDVRDVEDVEDSVDAAQGENDRFGVLVATDWSQENVTAAFQDATGSALAEASYDAQDGVLYRLSDDDPGDEPIYVGALGDGRIVLGDEPAVRASLDTEYAGADSLSGDLRDAYESTRDGYLSVAVSVPQEGQNGTAAEFGELRAMTAVYYADDGTVGLEGRMVLGSASDAQQFDRAIGGLLTSFRNGSSMDPETQQLLENVAVSQDGTDVVFTYESDLQELIEAAESQ